MIAFLISTVSILLVDKLICSQFTKARWFSLHVIFNFINILGTYKSFIYAIKSPIDLITDKSIYTTILQSRNSIWPTVYTITLHIYHVLFFKLRTQDIIHHFLFVPFLLCNLSYETKNITLFFACGLPGMISYIALCCKRYNIITKQTERQITFYQNLWLRVPGLLFSSFCVFYSYKYAKIINPSMYIVGTLCLLANINGLYYLQQISKKK